MRYVAGERRLENKAAIPYLIVASPFANRSVLCFTKL